MGLNDFGQIFIAVIGSIITFGLVAFFTWFINAWKKLEKRRNLYFLKIDCMIEALSNMGGEVGANFKSAYTILFNRVMDEEEFINKQ